MIDIEKMSKLKELNESKEFLGKMTDVASDAELKKLFAEYGVDFTDDEIKEITAKAKDEEVDVNTLDSVSGGAGVVPWTVLTYAASLVSKGAKTAWDLGKKSTKYF